MRIRLIFREILPFYFRLVVLAAVTLFIDLILHLTDLVWIGRYLGIPGVILILLSFGHSLRKRGGSCQVKRRRPQLAPPRSLQVVAAAHAASASARKRRRVGRLIRCFWTLKVL